MLKDIVRYNKNIEIAVNQNDNFSILKNKKILITGANGLIASCIIDILNWLNINKGYNIQIKALVRNKKYSIKRFREYKNFEFIEQDVTEELKYYDSIDFIIHAASNSHPKAFSSDPVGTILSNFIGMNNILEFAINHNCKRVEYISSGEVYGQGEENIKSFKESYIGKIDPTNPRNCYPLSKLAAENLCVSYTNQYKIETVIARPCHCYGPTQTDKDSRASAQFIRNVINDRDIIMKSNGKQIRSYCYVVDCAIGILTILTQGKNCKAYNVANNKSIVSVKQMAETIASKENKKVIFEMPSDIEKSSYNSVTKSILDGSELEKIGWVPIWNFKSGIEETIEIMK